MFIAKSTIKVNLKYNCWIYICNHICQDSIFDWQCLSFFSTWRVISTLRQPCYSYNVWELDFHWSLVQISMMSLNNNCFNIFPDFAGSLSQDIYTLIISGFAFPQSINILVFLTSCKNIWKIGTNVFCVMNL